MKAYHSNARSLARAIAANEDTILAGRRRGSAVLALSAALAITGAILAANSVRTGILALGANLPTIMDAFRASPASPGCHTPWPHAPRQYPMC